MRLFVNSENKRFAGVAAVAPLLYAILGGTLIWVYYKKLSVVLFILFLLLTVCILTIYARYLFRQSRITKSALHQIDVYLDGDMEVRIDCDYERESYHLFHEVNTMAAVLSVHAVNGMGDRDFLKDILSDISYQFKISLTILDICNRFLQNEAEGLPKIKEFTELSEQEIDRIETLIQSLFKIARLDVETLEMEKAPQNTPNIVSDIELYFSYCAKLGHKRLTLSGNNHIIFPCDRDWLVEATNNVIKNAFDYTKEDDSIQIEWEQFASITQIKIKDISCDIHPEGLHRTFERSYRSRFLQDMQGTGLGFPLAKVIIKAHDGTIEVESVLGAGTTFRVNLLTLTRLQSYGNITVRWRWQSFDIIKERGANSTNLSEVQSLSKIYGTGDITVYVLKAATFSVPKGEFVAIMGESGSGKSTLLNILGALDTPTSGEVFIGDKDIFFIQNQAFTVFKRRNIGSIFQSFSLILKLTVEQNIIFPVLLDYQRPNKKYLEEPLTILNLRERRDHLPSQLSSGQQQRVAISRVLITQPSLTPTDEPTGNPDTQNISEVILLLKDAPKKYEQTIIAITHNHSIAQTTDRALRVSDGILTDFGRCRE